MASHCRCGDNPGMALDAFKPLESPHLAVRRLEELDLAPLMDVNGDEQVTRYLPYRAWSSMDDARAWFERMRKIQEDGNALQLVVVEKASARAIGTCLIFKFDKNHGTAELGYVLGRAHWGRGYMSEALHAVIDAAFGPLGIRRLDAQIDPANAASRTLLERLGFVREGRLRERYVDRGGGFTDSEVFGLLRTEWRPRS